VTRKQVVSPPWQIFAQGQNLLLRIDGDWNRWHKLGQPLDSLELSRPINRLLLRISLRWPLPSTRLVIFDVTSPLPPTTTTTTAAADGSSLIVNELLSYVQVYQDKSNSENLHKMIMNFFLPTELTEAKREIISHFEQYLSDCPFRITRRQSQTRPAHDAETEDIVGMFNRLDNTDSLRAFQFVALNLDRLPKYGPEELNIGAIADRQVQLDNQIKAITNNLVKVKTAHHEKQDNLETQIYKISRPSFLLHARKYQC
jgi:hypothetical protein